MTYVPYRDTPLLIPSHLRVVSVDDKNIALHEQNLNEFYQNPTIEMVMSIYGSGLMDVLTNERYISLDGNKKLGLKFKRSRNPDADATRLLGSIAEALIVQACNNNKELNKVMLGHARGKGTRTSSAIADRYIAIATGSQQTFLNFGHYYNPCDTQRDIIWVDKNDPELQANSIVKGRFTSIKPAGLQIKTSHNFKNVVGTFKKYHYPIIYFDLNNDWHEAFMYVTFENMANPNANLYLVPHDDAILHLKQRLRGYFSIVSALMRDEISIEQIISHAKYNGDVVLSSIDSTAGDDSADVIITPIDKDKRLSEDLI
ncbi:hypothetical protein ACV2BG_004715 [Escherichia coli]|uniref:Uncharacterized protein n=3 Tax=Escherichia coli TaxID=562 RepID=A0A140CLR7_ECOLX|nr:MULTISPECIES: hypothetical protein [Enterobacteriaceae]EAV4183412.1 hypothetical protein [Salmonella enterica]EBW8591478.1 hypothetical protein [Salmonella enterica subsp. enterica serovar Senftenberg]ECB2534922.1 hypothetical protein [Salmonella enterica subsp. enterica serovar Give]EDH4763290.1 hypothetical protein [Salmonella enterica subsp. enterica serovar Enteritidis]EDK1073535.1 hypothetical protein [Salmonella enterica subsp. enterica serovar Schwarzengrund]EGF2691160.1 hypothetica